MTNPKITYILVGIGLLSMFAAIFGIYISKYTSAYGIADNNNTLEFYDKATELQITSENIKGNVSRISQPTGILDFIGGLFSSSYQVLKTVPNSFSMLFELMEQMVTDSNLGEGITLIKDIMYIIFIIVIFLGIILRIVLNQSEVI